MKLIDLLVQELPKRGGWPEGAKTVAQDLCGEVWGFNCGAPKINNGAWWSSASGTDLTSPSKVQIDLLADLLADDWSSTFITREQYEAAMAAKNGGWIEWGGGKCPVDDGEVVDVMFGRGGRISTNIAECWCWIHRGTSSDITAYRLHQPQEAEQPEASEEDLNECIGQDAAQVWGGEGKPAIGEKCEHHSGGQWEAVTIAGIYENLVTGFTDYWMVKEDGSSYTVGNPYRFRPIRSEADRKRDEAVQALCDAGGGNGKVDEKAGYGSCWFDVYDAIAAGKIPGVKLED